MTTTMVMTMLPAWPSWTIFSMLRRGWEVQANRFPAAARAPSAWGYSLICILFARTFFSRIRPPGTACHHLGGKRTLGLQGRAWPGDPSAVVLPFRAGGGSRRVVNVLKAPGRGVALPATGVRPSPNRAE